MGLAYVDQQGRARMNVDTTPVVNGNRGSVRIEDGYRFNGNTLVIMDATVSGLYWPTFNLKPFPNIFLNYKYLLTL